MSYLAAWIHSAVAQALGWTLAHFIWEGAVLAAMLMAMLRLFRGSPPRRRYAVACLILAAMPVAFAATFAVIWSRQPVSVPVRWIPMAGQAPIDPVTVPAPRFNWASLLDRLPWLVPLWFVGVAFFYTRGVAAWIAVQRLRRRGVCAPPPEWQARLNQLAERLRLSRPVAMLESCFTDAPVLIGYLRPVVLLPLGCLTGLSAAQVECILLHELAHVARHDYVVNLLQTVVEGLLFYHPAVWWASRVVRAERENCCDDRVVELMGDARSYAAALAALEERRAIAPQAALAVTGGNLMRRIRRLTADPRGERISTAPAASAGLVLLVFAAALAAVPAKLPMARHPRPAVALQGVALAAAAPQDTPYRKWLHEDVAYIITDAERAAFNQLLTDTEREQFIEAFWQRRGPQFKEEHYRRIAYANQHFSAGTPGWKTDRGRIYITYGPPDEIDDHPSNGSTFPFQQWSYRHIDGIGDNVVIEFVDPSRSGEFQMTMDPATPSPDQERRATEKQLRQELAAPYRKWLNEDVAYIATDEERAAFVRLQTDAERETFIENFWLRRDPTRGTVENEFKEEHYRRIAYANEHFSTGIPGWKTDMGRIYIMYGPPDAIQNFGAHAMVWTYRFIEGIGNDATFTFEDSPERHGEFHLTNEPAARQIDPAKPVQNAQAVSHEEPALSVNVMVAHLMAGRTPNALAEKNFEQAISAKRAECAALLRTDRPDHPDVLACNNDVQSLERQRQRVKVMDDFAAAVSKPEKTDRVAIVLVQLGSSKDEWHVFGEVTAGSHLVVQTFEQLVSPPGQGTLARPVLLSPGAYRIVVIAKNIATGAERKKELDFTVD